MEGRGERERERKGNVSDALSRNPGSERGTTPGSALSIGVGVSSTSLFARRRRFLSLFLLPSTRHPPPLSPSSFIARSHLHSVSSCFATLPFFSFSRSPSRRFPTMIASLSIVQSHPSIRPAYMFPLYLLYFAATSDDRVLVPRQITLCHPLEATTLAIYASPPSP